MELAKFEYFAPKTLKEATELLSDLGDGAHLLAGGTDLMMKIGQGLLKPKAVVGLKRIAQLNDIVFKEGKGLTIGATALLADVASHPAIRRHYPAVAYAAGETANTQIRNMGTVVGNLCNAAPSADNAPTLIAMGAEVTLIRSGGERNLPLDQFFRGPGLTAMEPGEILASIFVRLPPHRSGTSYKHMSARGKVDISAVGVGVMIAMDGETIQEARIAMGAVGPIPMRAVKAEKVLRGKRAESGLFREAGLRASKECAPISDVRASAAYRRNMVRVLTQRALEEAYRRVLP
jgi:carbon-monoxide dehydrogenase medium subunit